MLDINEAIARALRNIAKFGDTDIFPFLFERHVFYDSREECQKLLVGIHTNFETVLHE